MNRALRKLNDSGLAQFSTWLSSGASGSIPLTLLTDPSTSDALPIDVSVPLQEDFTDRYEFGVYLNQLLSHFDTTAISRDRGLWSAMALLWFDLLCPPDKATGERSPDKEYRYILEANYQTYYRHLVRSPWQCVRDHGDSAKFMLIRPKKVDHPLSIHGEILEQIAGRQRLFGSKSIVRAANAMYFDPKSGRPRRGVAGAGPGSALRFGKVVRQLDLTFDPELMTVDQFIHVLPKEFSKWKDAMKASR
jgi:hypothetical protein